MVIFSWQFKTIKLSIFPGTTEIDAIVKFIETGEQEKVEGHDEEDDEDEDYDHHDEL